MGGVIQFGGGVTQCGDGGDHPGMEDPFRLQPSRFGTHRRRHVSVPPPTEPRCKSPPPTAPSPFSDRSVLLSGLRAALEALGVPCYLGGAARGLLPPESPLLLRHNRRDALRDADLVLLAGASPGSGRHRDAPRCPRVPTSHPPPPLSSVPPEGSVCDFRLSYGRLFGRGAAVVAVNRDRAQLLRNADVFWKPRLAVQGDRKVPSATPPCYGVTPPCYGERRPPPRPRVPSLGMGDRLGWGPG